MASIGNPSGYSGIRGEVVQDMEVAATPAAQVVTTPDVVLADVEPTVVQATPAQVVVMTCWGLSLGTSEGLMI